MTRSEREAQLIEVAEAVFAERGFKSVSMDEIAERARISKPVLYDHFGSKDGLLAAVVLRIRTEMRAAVEDALVTVTEPDEALWVGLRAYFRFISSHVSAWSVLLAENALTGPVAEEVEGTRRQQSELISTLAAAQLPPEDAGKAVVFAEAVIGACERLVLLQRTRQTEWTPESLSTELLDFFFIGFRALRQGDRWTPPDRLLDDGARHDPLPHDQVGTGNSATHD
jgi:AcrR family transcriptional regulator